MRVLFMIWLRIFVDSVTCLEYDVVVVVKINSFSVVVGCVLFFCSC